MVVTTCGLVHVAMWRVTGPIVNPIFRIGTWTKTEMGINDEGVHLTVAVMTDGIEIISPVTLQKGINTLGKSVLLTGFWCSLESVYIRDQISVTPVGNVGYLSFRTSIHIH